MKYKDITGQKFGKLTVLYPLKYYKNGYGMWWLCVCECGNLTLVKGGDLRRKKFGRKSCGCLQKIASKKHGKRHTRLYYIWTDMKQRCYNINLPAYRWYGGRGVVVYSEWKDDFMNFYDWSMANGYSDNLTIDRIDVDGNYSPDNCRWADWKQQNRNKRSNTIITINGETHCLKEWCEILGLRIGTVCQRLYYGWSMEKALELEDKPCQVSSVRRTRGNAKEKK